MSKTHWKQLQNPDYLGAYSLPDGKDIIVEIESVKKEIVKGQGGSQDECTVMRLKGQKPMIVNVTNAKSITKVIGTPYVEDWIGNKIQLFVSTTQLKGEQVECLRVRTEKPKEQTKPELSPNHPNWVKAKKAVDAKTYSIEKLKEMYVISKESEELLLVV